MAETTAETTPPPATPEPTPLNGATPPPAEKPKEEDSMAKKFAALSRKEKEIVRQQQEHKASVEAFKKDQELFNSERGKMLKLVDAVANAKTNPKAILDAAGVSYDELTRFILADGKPDPNAKFTELEQKLEEERQARLESEKAREEKERAEQERYIERMIDQYRNEVNSHIAANPDEYESIIAYGAEDQVFSKIYEHFKAEGEILAPDAAAKAVEDELLETIVEQTLKLKKVQTKLKPPEPEKKEEPAPKIKTPPKTLSSAQVAPASKPTASLAKAERLKAAMQKLVFTDR